MAILRELTSVDTDEHDCFQRVVGVLCISKAIRSFGSNDLHGSELISHCT